MKIQLPPAAHCRIVTLHKKRKKEKWLHLCIWQDHCNYSRVSVWSDTVSGLDNSVALGGTLRSGPGAAHKHTHTHTQGPDSDDWEIMTQGKATHMHTLVPPPPLRHQTSTIIMALSLQNPGSGCCNNRALAQEPYGCWQRQCLCLGCCFIDQ